MEYQAAAQTAAAAAATPPAAAAAAKTTTPPPAAIARARTNTAKKNVQAVGLTSPPLFMLVIEGFS